MVLPRGLSSLAIRVRTASTSAPPSAGDACANPPSIAWRIEDLAVGHGRGPLVVIARLERRWDDALVKIGTSEWKISGARPMRCTSPRAWAGTRAQIQSIVAGRVTS